jgi:hypothetical protein
LEGSGGAAPPQGVLESLSRLRNQPELAGWLVEGLWVKKPSEAS